MKKNNIKYKSDRINFIEIDIINEKIPKKDLMIARDVLFHFSFDDIFKFFKQFLESNTLYLLTTTHYNNSNFENKDIITGGFRLIDFFSPPFNLPNKVLYRFDDYPKGAPPREMILISREVILNLVNLK